MKFKHRVSKGSRFNQIYIPKKMEGYFEVGDLVEVSLLKKKIKLYCSENIKELSEFKEDIIKKAFSILNDFSEIKQIFVFGSFLTQKIDYNDIDILIITNKKDIEGIVRDKLIEKISLRFHVIAISEDNFSRLREICPLVNSMLYYYASNKNLDPIRRKIDKNHIKFLMMLPEDLLKVKASSRAFYDSIRRLITIEMFLKNEDLDPLKTDKLLELRLGKFIFLALRNNEPIEDNEISKLREIIKKKLKDINQRIQNEQIKNNS